MKISNWSVCALLLFSALTTEAQEIKQMSLDEVMQRTYANSIDAKVLDYKVKAKELEFQNSKSNILPDAKISGSYLAVNSPTVDLKILMG